MTRGGRIFNVAPQWRSNLNPELKKSAQRVLPLWGATGAITLLFASCRPEASWIYTLFALGTIFAAYACYLSSAYRSNYLHENNAVMLGALFALVSLTHILFFAGYYFAFDLLGQHSFVTTLYLSTGVFTGLGIGNTQPSTPHGEIFIIAEAVLGITHMVFFVAFFLTKFRPGSPQRETPQPKEESKQPQSEQALAQMTTKPTTAQYLAASEAELIEMLNNNHGDQESDFPFIQSVLAVRTAESHRRTNELLVRQTKLLVIATWAICAATVVASYWEKSCGA